MSHLGAEPGPHGPLHTKWDFQTLAVTPVPTAAPHSPHPASTAVEGVAPLNFLDEC